MKKVLLILVAILVVAVYVKIRTYTPVSEHASICAKHGSNFDGCMKRIRHYHEVLERAGFFLSWAFRMGSWLVHPRYNIERPIVLLLAVVGVFWGNRLIRPKGKD